MQTVRSSAQKRGKPTLRIASSPRDAWEGIIRPWFRAVAPIAWKRALPSLVVVPTRSHAHALKARLLQESSSHLGLRFVTPAGLREFLRAETSNPHSASEHLRLLLAIAAEEIGKQTAPSAAHESDLLAAKAIMRAPDHLLRTLNLLEAAGWDFHELRSSSFHSIVQRFREHLRTCGFDLTARLDRAAARQAPKQAPRISRLLVAGFDGAHWPDWFILRAAVEAAEESTVVLQDPRDEARNLDETWVGSWEENYGEARAAGSSPPRGDTLFPELFEPELLASRRSGARPPSHTYFLVGRTVTEQARAIAALIKEFLTHASGERIGILFPATGALPRTVAAFLSDEEIPHYDGIAHLAPGPLEDDAWSAWLELQENPRLRILLRFLRAAPAADGFFAGLRVDRIEDILRRAHVNLIVDDLDLLRAYCAHHSLGEGADKVANGLEAIRFLPEQATFSEFLGQTRAIFEGFKWRDRAFYLDQASAVWHEAVPAEFCRATYLRWLTEVSTSLLPARDREGDHPYSRVQLLLYPHAEGQQWSHLIFAGLNEGSWPPRADEPGFLDDREVEALNTRIRKLNRQALRQGSQGEGHSIAAEGRTFCLGPLEHRALAERQFQNLRESVTVGVAASASLVEENAPERFANPSEFFTRLYFEAEGVAPGQSTMAALEEQTAAWLGGEKERRPKEADTDIRQTAVAYQARNTPEIPFGEYEFALREPLDREVTLSATDWERLIKAPALIWLKKFLGVEAPDDEFANWNMAIGQWVHDWLSHIAKSDGALVQRPRAKDVRDRVQRAARDFRAEVAAMLGRPLPDWWISTWNQAAFIADTLAETITTTESWSHFATEWTLPPSAIRVSETAQFAVRGRIDLLMAREERAGETFRFQDAWIIDYKTGRRLTLAPGRKSAGKASEDFRTKLLEGKGVQLAIYALALHALGAQEIGISLLTRDLELDSAQVSFPVIEAQREIWEEFASLSRSGIFGMRGALRAEFQFQNDYPLATLGFDPDFLEEKWNATHPALPKIEKRP